MNWIIEKLTNKKKMMIQFSQLLWQQRYKLFAVLAVLIAGVALKLTTPLAVGKIFDVVYEGIIASFYYGTSNFYFDFHKFGEIIWLLLVKEVASWILFYFQKRLMRMVGKGFVQSLKNEVENKLAKLSCSARKKKELLKQAVLDAEHMSQSLQTNVMKSVTSLLTIVVTYILMFQINWILASAFVLIVSVIGIGNRQQSEDSRIIRFFQYVATSGLGLIFLAQGKLSFGQVQAFFQYMGKATTPFVESSLQSLKSMFVSAERVSCLLDEYTTS